MKPDRDVADHYSRPGLLARLEAALIEDGVDPARPSLEALAPYDQFHGRGLERAIDEKLIELRASPGSIPSRSEVLRLALAAYLGMSLDETEADHRSTTGPVKRKAR